MVHEFLSACGYVVMLWHNPFAHLTVFVGSSSLAARGKQLRYLIWRLTPNNDSPGDVRPRRCLEPYQHLLTLGFSGVLLSRRTIYSGYFICVACFGTPWPCSSPCFTYPGYGQNHRCKSLSTSRDLVFVSLRSHSMAKLARSWVHFT